MRWGSVEGLWLRRGNGGDIAPLRQLLCFSSKRGMALLHHDLPLKVAASHYIPERGRSLKSLSGLPKLWGEYFFSLHKLLSDVFDIARECCLIWVCAGIADLHMLGGNGGTTDTSSPTQAQILHGHSLLTAASSLSFLYDYFNALRHTVPTGICLNEGKSTQLESD